MTKIPRAWAREYKKMGFDLQRTRRELGRGAELIPPKQAKEYIHRGGHLRTPTFVTLGPYIDIERGGGKIPQKRRAARHRRTVRKSLIMRLLSGY